MVQILVKAVDAYHADPEIDKKGCYKRNDPVIVVPDDHKWGRLEWPDLYDEGKVYEVGDRYRTEEGKHYKCTAPGIFEEFAPKFIVVSYPGVAAEQVPYLDKPEVESLEEITSLAVRKNARLLRLVAREKERKVKTRRRYQVNLDDANQIKDKVK